MEIEELDVLVIEYMNIMVEEVWDVMNNRPAGTESISVNGQDITESILEKVSDEVELLTFTQELDVMVSKVHNLVGHQYFIDYTAGLESTIQIRINEILKNINI